MGRDEKTENATHSDLRMAAEMALEVLQPDDDIDPAAAYHAVIALRSALSRNQQFECLGVPVAWRVRYKRAPDYWIIFQHYPTDAMQDPEREVFPLYSGAEPIGKSAS